VPLFIASGGLLTLKIAIKACSNLKVKRERERERESDGGEKV
jgi:hypothetical protein